MARGPLWPSGGEMAVTPVAGSTKYLSSLLASSASCMRSAERCQGQPNLGGAGAPGEIFFLALSVWHCICMDVSLSLLFFCDPVEVLPMPLMWDSPSSTPVIHTVGWSRHHVLRLLRIPLLFKVVYILCEYKLV